MIKEIMLATALTNSGLLYYDLNGNAAHFNTFISSNEFVYNESVNLVIDLNSGDSYVCDLAINESGTIPEWEVYRKRNIDNYNNALNLSYFYNYIYEELGFRDDAIILSDYVEIGFKSNMIGINFVDSDEPYYNCFYAMVSSENDNILFQLGDEQTTDISYDNVNGNYVFVSSGFPMNSLNQDLLLVIQFYNVVLDSNANGLYIDFYFPYESVYMEFEVPNDIYIDSSALSDIYTNFIYHDFIDIVSENEDLRRENELFEEIINDLRQENDELNSRHVFSNVFELVRGSFDGVIRFLQTDIMPNVSIGMLLFIPVVFGVIYFILKALVF